MRGKRRRKTGMVGRKRMEVFDDTTVVYRAK